MFNKKTATVAQPKSEALDLPDGYDDPDSAFYVPAPMRSYYAATLAETTTPETLERAQKLVRRAVIDELRGQHDANEKLRKKDAGKGMNRYSRRFFNAFDPAVASQIDQLAKSRDMQAYVQLAIHEHRADAAIESAQRDADAESSRRRWERAYRCEFHGTAHATTRLRRDLPRPVRACEDCYWDALHTIVEARRARVDHAAASRIVEYVDQVLTD